MVVIARAAAGADFCSVSADDVTGGELAAGRRRAPGHRRPAFLGDFTDRIRAVRHAMSFEHDPATLVELPVAGTLDGGHAGGRELATQDPTVRPTGVICGNDPDCALRAERRRHPGAQDIAVVGHDDIVDAAAAPTPTGRHPPTPRGDRPRRGLPAARRDHRPDRPPEPRDRLTRS